jgi:hypothetical protein
VHGFNQVDLVFHNLIDVLVGTRDFVDNALVLTAFDSFGLVDQIFPAELLRAAVRDIRRPAPCAQELKDFSLPLPRTM